MQRVLRLIAAASTLLGLAGRATRVFTGEPTIDRPRLTADDWPCWRGAASDNHSVGQAPLQWDEETNVLWKMPLPGRGHASPCIVGDNVYVAAADEATGVQFLVALKRQSGEILWRTDLHRGPLPKINDKNSHASATPASDGQWVFTLFAVDDQLWVSAVDASGSIVWQKATGRYAHANGLGSSPVIFGDLIIVANDSTAEASLTALRAADGSIAWRTARRASDNSATPIVGFVSGRRQLLINGAYSVNSYDPVTGAELWYVTHKTEVAACTMAFDGQRVFASGNVPEPSILAVRGDGSGDVSETHLLWKMRNLNTYVPSPLCVGDRLFVVTDDGVAWCRDSAMGDIVWKRRLGGNFSASPLLADGMVYALSEEGVMHIFRASERYEPIATNEVPGTCLATPVICGGKLYLRTDAGLYCIGDSAGL